MESSGGVHNSTNLFSMIPTPTSSVSLPAAISYAGSLPQGIYLAKQLHKRNQTSMHDGKTLDQPVISLAFQVTSLWLPSPTPPLLGKTAVQWCLHGAGMGLVASPPRQGKVTQTWSHSAWGHKTCLPGGNLSGYQSTAAAGARVIR